MEVKALLLPNAEPNCFPFAETPTVFFLVWEVQALLHA